MDSNFLLSVVIPCYNDAEFIQQSVKSALNQTYQNKEVIVVDDGSNLETKQVLKSLESRITKLITQENKGQSSARNVGIKNAKGKYILVLDSDDFFERSFCEKAVNIMSASKNTKLVSCYINIIEEDKFKIIYKPSGGNLKNMLLNNAAFGSLMFRKEDWISIAGYDEAMRNGFEDWEFYIRLLKNGGNAHIMKEPLFNYRRRLNSTTTKANAIKFDLLKFIYLKHMDLYNDNYELFVTHLLNRIEREEKEKIKKENSLEYQLGLFILRPFRFIKQLFS